MIRKSNIFATILFVLLTLGVVSVSRVYGQETPGIIGKVTSVINRTLVAVDKKGLSQTITTDNATKILGENNAIRTLATIKTGDTVGAVFGQAASTSGVATSAAAVKIVAKLYIKEGSPSGQQKTPPTLLAGVVTGVNNTIVTLLVKDITEMFYNVTASDSAVVKIGNATGAVSSLELGQQLVVVGTGSQDEFNASLLHAIVK